MAFRHFSEMITLIERPQVVAYKMPQLELNSLQIKKIEMFKNTFFLLYVGYTPKQ